MHREEENQRQGGHTGERDRYPKAVSWLLCEHSLKIACVLDVSGGFVLVGFNPRFLNMNRGLLLFTDFFYGNTSSYLCVYLIALF